MTYVGSDSKSHFQEQLGKTLSARLPKEQVTKVLQFAEYYFSSAPMEDLRGGRFEDFYASLILSWKFIQQHPTREIDIRVFNPELEEHGWQSTHTVIEVLMDDIPFLVDSMRIELNRREIYMHRIQEAILPVHRNQDNELIRLVGPGEATEDAHREVLLHIEVDRQPSEAQITELRDALVEILEDVHLVNADFPAMRDHCVKAIEDLRSNPPPLEKSNVEEVAEFLSWLSCGQFTFLGYDELRFSTVDGRRVLEPVRESVLGTRRKNIDERESLDLEDLGLNVQSFMQAPKLIAITKSSTRSCVHRAVYPDYVAVRNFNKRGEVVSEKRFLGLFTAKFYNETLNLIPLVRRKVSDIMARSGIDSESHAGKALMQILHNYPRDELLETGTAELFEIVTGILNIQERRQVRMFARRDPYNKFVTAMVFCPKDIFNTELRLRFQEILVKSVGALDSDFTTQLTESVLARVHFILRIDPALELKLDTDLIEEQIRHAARTWSEELHSALVDHFGEASGNMLFHEYRDAFPAGYREDFNARSAAADIQHIQEMDRDANLGMSFYRAVEEDGQLLRFKLFQVDHLMPLSEVVPILENLGLCVMAEHPHDVRPKDGSCIWIRDFSLRYRHADTLDLHAVKENFLEAFAKIWVGRSENDSFNRLVLGGGFSWREVAMFRSFSRYNKQIRFGLSEGYAADTLAKHAGISRQLLEYFILRFDPDLDLKEAHLETKLKVLTEEILAGLDGVEILDEDRILRRYLELMDATLRTNFFQQDGAGEPRESIALKIDCRAIVEMPNPRPMFEIFVYSPRVEGVHLRGGKVARGGLRWSDRMEDFRTEVLGLVKAQQVKNAVIVPVGAKGGFVAKRLPTEGGREEFLKEGIECYRIFIRALLDITDNRDGDQIIPPKRVVRHDPDDPYLVVAADKGTATFSDIANGIAGEHDFWLGDAFASGGSVGYDHKGMGITARGAWVSVQRHFREIGIDVQNEDFSVVGVGDMSGDVFGNGMLLSEHICLIAAFNHLHIFIDPDPDAASSYAERKRLFEMPRSSWEDYDRNLMSKGGGIFQRSAKSITMTPEIKQRFGIEVDRMPPNDFLKAILCAETDLFWNGGIGTYVKSTSESHLDVGDKGTDAIRIDGKQLRARVVGEGGNLGLTQLGRIEYCLNGGRCNTDFIDNAGGVDCSDHEVNIKILLDAVVTSGDMTGKQRNQLLAEMTDDVSDLVLQNNYRQTQAISVAELEVAGRMEEYRQLISSMESSGRLDRQLEFIPDDDVILERKLRGKGLTRPELSVMISYTKADLKEQLIDSQVPDDPYLQREVETAFPARLASDFHAGMYGHRLRREIVATQIANDVTNRMGITFIHRLTESTGTKPSQVSRAYIISRDVFEVEPLWQQIEALDHKVEASVQLEMMAHLMRLLRRSARWFLRHRRAVADAEQIIAEFRPGIRELSWMVPNLIVGVHQETLHSKESSLIERGVPQDLAHSIASLAALYNGLGIIDAAHATGHSVERVAETFFKLGDRLQLHWFSRQITDLAVENHWQAMARETFRDDLDWQRRSLTIGLLQMKGLPEDLDERIDLWLTQYKPLVDRWHNMLNGLRSAGGQDFAMYAVAVRELLDLAQSTVLRAIPEADRKDKSLSKSARRSSKVEPEDRGSDADDTDADDTDADDTDADDTDADDMDADDMDADDTDADDTDAAPQES